jgi:hypothetical protein
VSPTLVLCAMLLSICTLVRPAEALPLLFTAETPAPASSQINSAPTAEALGPLAWYGIASAIIFASDPATSANDGTVAPIPLPAAGWLLVAGLGALGLFRRRAAGHVPLRTALRECARTEWAPRSDAPARHFHAAASIHLWRRSAARSERLTAFPPCRVLLSQFKGRVGMREAASAERAPPMFVPFQMLSLGISAVASPGNDMLDVMAARYFGVVFVCSEAGAAMQPSL